MIKQGLYEHYKGNLYQVLGTARHSETLEEMVIYQALYSPYGLWVRPAALWTEDVTHQGVTRPRFAYLAPTWAEAPCVAARA